MIASHASPTTLLQQAASLLLYQSVLADEVGQAFLALLQALQTQSSRNHCLQAYSHWFQLLAQRDRAWQDHLITRIIYDENPFSQQVQLTPLAELSPSLVKAAQADLSALQSLYHCHSKLLSEWVQNACQLNEALVAWEKPLQVDHFLHDSNDWQSALPQLAQQYQQHGCGKFAQYRAFSWQNGQLVGIAHPDPINLSEIVGYEWQKETLVQNTEFLLQGYRALHVLLYGSRGSGKSSIVKGLLNQYAHQGLRLVEVPKSQLRELPSILEQLQGVPQKFIIFVDDLSFEEDDDAFKALKVVLEGSVTARADNVVVYATSNRRHLVREYFADRPRPSDQEEVHAWDTVQEKLSFSDRFGLSLTFEPPNQDTYLDIVHHLAQLEQISLSQEDLDFRAKQWATRHNGRSGRSARQFIDFLKGELATDQA